MNVGELCTREVVCCQRDTPILAAAQLMRAHHVGDLVVVEQRAEERIPVGIITDRDLVIEVLAKEVNPSTLTVGDLSISPVFTAGEYDGVYETIERMQSKGVRRVPIVNRRQGLVGMLTLDDVSEYLAEELNKLSKIVIRQQQRETQIRV